MNTVAKGILTVASTKEKVEILAGLGFARDLLALSTDFQPVTNGCQGSLCH